MSFALSHGNAIAALDPDADRRVDRADQRVGDQLAEHDERQRDGVASTVGVIVW